VSTTLLKYTVVYLETTTTHALCDVHALGCADLEKPRNQRGVQVNEELDLDDLEKFMPVLDADELGYHVSDVKVHGCAEDAHKAAKASTGKRTPRGSKAVPAAPAPAADAVKNVKLKRGSRVHTPGANGLPVCRATGTADKYEATGKEVSCTACAKVTAPVAAQTPAKARTRSTKATTPAVAPQPASGARRARQSARVGFEVDGQGNELDYDKRPMNIADNRPTPPTSGRKRRNGKAQDQAAAQAATIVAEATAAARQSVSEEVSADALAFHHGVPAVNAKCTAEQADLAIKVRELRSTGMAWWKIAHELGLPGSGPSVKQGKTGAAHARRAWERAWGKTYSDTSVPRETKAIKKERALTHEPRPYFSADVEDIEIVDAVSGQPITWFTRVGTTGGAVVSEQVAEVHVGSAKVVRGPKGRVLEFNERIYETTTSGSGVKTPMVGPLRSVYVDRIEKVGA